MYAVEPTCTSLLRISWFTLCTTCSLSLALGSCRERRSEMALGSRL